MHTWISPNTGTILGTLPPASALPPIPLFAPDPTTRSGLDLLASAAAVSPSIPATSQANSSTPTLPVQSQDLHARGPFNPAASLPARTVKRILDLEFIDMAELTIDDMPSGRTPAPPRLAITSISQWVERFSLMAAVLVSRFPEKAAELFAYQATIVRAERNYEGTRWVLYDRQFRREALARKDLNWSQTDSRLYNEAFTGRARSIARCAFCLQDDHTSSECPKNPSRPWADWLPTQALAWSTPPPIPAQGSAPTEVCRRYNDGRCKYAKCRFAHLCKICFAPHPSLTCPRSQGTANPARDRSPHPFPCQGPTRGITQTGFRMHPPT